MSTMVDVSSELKLNGVRQQKLRQTFQQVEAQSSSILFLALQWKDIDSHFDSIQRSISQRQDQLVSLEGSLRKRLEEIQLREKRVESVEESVNLRFKELESREAGDKLLFEKREKALELMSVSVEERWKEVDTVRLVVEQGLKTLDLKEKQFVLLEKSVDDKSKELQFVQHSIKQSFEELELREKETDLREKKLCEKNKRGKRPLADGETERFTKHQRHGIVAYPHSSSHSEADGRANKGGKTPLAVAPLNTEDKTRLRDPGLRTASLKLELLIELIRLKICDEIEPCRSQVIKDLMDRIYRFINLVIVFENKTAVKLKDRGRELRDLLGNFKKREEEFSKEKKAYTSATREAALRFPESEKQAFNKGWIKALKASKVDHKSQLFINIPVYDSTSVDDELASPRKKSKVSDTPCAGEDELKSTDCSNSEDQYPDTDFHDFDKDKAEECFQADQIWAVYDGRDSMPRLYVRIRKVLRTESKLLMTWLEPNPGKEAGASSDRPVAYGNFTQGTSESLDRLMFSHKVQVETLKCNGKVSYLIYPRKGETWALFQDWDIGLCSDADKYKLAYNFDLVEIISDYDKSEGIWVADLSKIKGFVSLFKQSSFSWSPFKISPNEFFKFSHQIPSFRMTGAEREGIPRDSIELDPVSLPRDLDQFYALADLL